MTFRSKKSRLDRVELAAPPERDPEGDKKAAEEADEAWKFLGRLIGRRIAVRDGLTYPRVKRKPLTKAEIEKVNHDARKRQEARAGSPILEADAAFALLDELIVQGEQSTATG